MQALKGENDYHTISMYENCILHMFFKRQFCLRITSKRVFVWVYISFNRFLNK